MPRETPISVTEIVSKFFKNFAPAMGVIFAAHMAVAQDATSACFVENLPAPNAAQAYNAKMRALMVAHIPLEYRSSCSLTDETDHAYFEAIRATVACQESAAYQAFFGRMLSGEGDFAFAVKKTDLRSDADFDLYCQIVERIDLSNAVAEDGSVNAQALQLHAPLYQALQSHIAKTRWDQ